MVSRKKVPNLGPAEEEGRRASDVPAAAQREAAWDKAIAELMQALNCAPAGEEAEPWPGGRKRQPVGSG